LQLPAISSKSSDLQTERTSQNVATGCALRAQLVFDFCGCYELQPTTPNPPQFGSDVLIEEVSTAAKRLRRLSRRQRPAELAGNV
jgi:hypothetical protein